MSTYLAKHIQRRLVTLVHFMQRLLGTTFIRFLTALFENLGLSLRFLRSICHILRKKNIDHGEASTIDAGGQSQTSALQSTDYEQIVIPLDNIACAFDPSNGVCDDLGSRSPLILDVPVFPSAARLSRDRNPKSLHISVPDDSCFPTYLPTSEQPYLISSPTADIIHRPEKVHHRMLGYRQQSIELLAQGEMSSSRKSDIAVITAPPTCSPIDLRETPSPQETLISSPTSIEYLKTPALCSERIRPTAPENFMRYEKRRKIPQEGTKAKMSPFLIDFSDHDDIQGWTTCIHPEGGRYFHHAEKRVFTDTDLHDSGSFAYITTIIDIINTFIIDHRIHIPERTDLVLELGMDNKINKCVASYYFANHTSRTVFFLHEFSTVDLPHWSEIKGVNSGTHLRQALEMQYWWHCHSYPNCIDLSNDLVRELRSSVVFSVTDCMTSPFANSPYPLEKLEKILSYISSVNENVVDGGSQDSGCINFLGRLMYDFKYKRYLDFYGQPEARLNRDQSVYGNSTNQRTWFIKAISIFLFSAPDIHLETLQKMWVDKILHKAVWEELLKKVSDEWREFILYSTVMLNANVAFLAINSVDTNRNPYRSPAQISSYCSISCSVGSIMIGLILARQNQTKHRDTALAMQSFLTKMNHRWVGLELLAIMFSLPYVLLMWGVISFLLAFWFMCLQDSGFVTRSVIATVCGIILILMVWCIWTSWEEKPKSDASDPEDHLSFEVDDAYQKPKGFKFERDTPQQPTECRRQSTILSWSPTFPLNIRRDTSMTMVEESEDGGKAESCS